MLSIVVAAATAGRSAKSHEHTEQSMRKANAILSSW